MGQELSRPTLALADDGGGADRGRDRQRDDDRDRCEQEHGQRIRRLTLRRVPLDLLTSGVRQDLECLADLLDDGDVAGAGDDQQEDERDHDEEETAEQHHRDPEVLGLDELLQVGAGHGAQLRPAQGAGLADARTTSGGHGWRGDRWRCDGGHDSTSPIGFVPLVRRTAK